MPGDERVWKLQSRNLHANDFAMNVLDIVHAYTALRLTTAAIVSPFLLRFESGHPSRVILEF
jgi:hypothetical protein